MVISMTQVIYADILFIVNTYVNYALLRLACLFCRRQAKTYRMLLASSFGGLYSFIILIENIPQTVVFLTRLAAAALIILIAAGFLNCKAFLRLAAVFLCVSYAFAGIMLALWSFFSPPQMYYNNTVVYFNINTLTLCIFTVVCYGLLWLINQYLLFKAPANTIYQMEFEAFENTYYCTAFLDTGNMLKEPFSSLPVIIVSDSLKGSSAGETLKKSMEEHPQSIRYIPCGGVNGSSVLAAFRPQSIHIRGISVDLVTDNAFIALTTQKIKSGDYDALIGSALFENNTKETEKDYLR